MNKAEFIKHCDSNVNKFIDELGVLKKSFTVSPRGVWASECFALCMMLDFLNAKSYIESGVYKGQSLRNVKQYFGNKLNLVGVDKEKNIDGFVIDCVVLICDVNKIYHRLFDTFSNAGWFIDGPKGMDAVKLVNKILPNDHTSFVAVHDMCNLSHIKNNARHELEGRYDTFSTDDIDFVSRYSYLDNLRWHEYLAENGTGNTPFYKRNGLGQHLPLKSYGPTITFCFNKGV